jgi:glycosyltransferase involved in cell wall biosynthesis
MKVLLVNLGVSAYTVPLANALADLVDLTFIQPERLTTPWLSQMNPKMRMIFCELPRIREPQSPLAVSRLLDLIGKLKPDVLHMQEAVNPWFDVLASLRTLPPMVTTIHDVTRHPGDEKGAWLLSHTRKLMFRKSQAIIVHANVLKDTLANDWGVPKEQVYVVPHGELGSLYLNIDRTAALAMPRDPLTVLFFGRILRYKGLDVLASAMEIVRRSISNARLIIAGRGDPVSRYLSANSPRDHIEVINHFIPHSEVGPLFRRAGLLAVPYVEASQSGVACIAMATGTPIVASAIGGLAELIHDRIDGLLVPPANPQALANAILALMTNEDLRLRLAAAAVARCQQDLSWPNIARTTAGIYADVLSQQHHQRPS